MDKNKIIKTVLMGLTTDLFKTEAELESTMNSTSEIKLKKIKKLLNKMVLIENSIAKFNSLIGENNNKE